MGDKEYREYLITCGFSKEEVEQKIKDRYIMRDLYFKSKQEPREITSQAYQISHKKMTRKVERFLGVL